MHDFARGLRLYPPLRVRYFSTGADSEGRREKGAEVSPSFKSAVAEGIQVGSRMSAALSRA